MFTYVYTFLFLFFFFALLTRLPFHSGFPCRFHHIVSLSLILIHCIIEWIRLFVCVCGWVCANFSGWIGKLKNIKAVHTYNKMNMIREDAKMEKCTKFFRVLSLYLAQISLPVSLFVYIIYSNFSLKKLLIFYKRKRNLLLAFLHVFLSVYVSMCNYFFMFFVLYAVHFSWKKVTFAWL